MKTVGSTLAMHFGQIKLSDGTIVKPKSLDDRVVMDYAPIDPDADLSDLPPFASVTKPDANGNRYLETTVAHEYLLINNAAFDHSNKKVRGMLVNMWGLKNDDWFVSRMYEVIESPHKIGDKKILAGNSIKLLKKLNALYNYSPLKNMRSPERFILNTESLINEVHDVNKRLNMNEDDLALNLKEETRISARNGGTLIEIDGIDINEGVVTPDEKIITSLANRMNETLNMNGSYPLVYSRERYELNHLYTRKEMMDQFEDDVDAGKYTNDELREGSQFARKFAPQFYGLFQEAKKKKETDETTFLNQRVEYNEEMYNLVQNATKSLDSLVNKHGEGVREIFTISILSGLNDVKNVRMIPALKLNDRYLLSEKIYVDYLTRWENNFFTRVAGVLKPTELMQEIKALRTGKARMKTYVMLVNNRQREDC